MVCTRRREGGRQWTGTHTTLQHDERRGRDVEERKGRREGNDKNKNKSKNKNKNKNKAWLLGRGRSGTWRHE